MGGLTWTAPSAFWLLLAIPAVWAAHLGARTNFNVRQRRLQAVVRSLLLAALVAALARPVISNRTSRESIVYAVDVSQSVGTRSIEDAARRIDEIAAEVSTARALAPNATMRECAGREAAVISSIRRAASSMLRVPTLCETSTA